MCAILPIREALTTFSLLQAFQDIMPSTRAPEQKTKPEDFTRTRKLPFPQLIVFIVSLVANGNHHGVEIHSGDFSRDARRSGLWPDAEAVHRSAVSKTRLKVPWTVFQDILNDVVRLASDIWSGDPL